jgi:hypothetical protein
VAIFTHYRKVTIEIVHVYPGIEHNLRGVDTARSRSEQEWSCVGNLGRRDQSLSNRHQLGEPIRPTYPAITPNGGFFALSGDTALNRTSGNNRLPASSALKYSRIRSMILPTTMTRQTVAFRKIATPLYLKLLTLCCWHAASHTSTSSSKASTQFYDNIVDLGNS